MSTLFLVGTPIGNLEDITHRALRVLSEVGLIAAEDTRRTGKLLNHYQIETPLLSFHDHNERARLGPLMQVLEEGDLALVSDAGMPGLSDPGFVLVSAALEAGHEVSPIPGPSAPIAALVASGLPTDSFLFLGYLPRREKERIDILRELASIRQTLLAFETPHRLRQALQDLETVFGPDRQIAVCRELTKMNEEIVRGAVGKVREHFEDQEPRGEMTLVIAGASSEERWEESRVREAIKEFLAKGTNPSQTSKEVAAASGWARQEVYRLTLEDG